MLFPLSAHSTAVTYDLIAVFCCSLCLEAGDLALPESFCNIRQRIALATKTKDDLLALVCPVFNADV
jgi:hypothetical protein